MPFSQVTSQDRISGQTDRQLECNAQCSCIVEQLKYKKNLFLTMTKKQQNILRTEPTATSLINNIKLNAKFIVKTISRTFQPSKVTFSFNNKNNLYKPKMPHIVTYQ